jgi:hypothetical protein
MVLGTLVINFDGNGDATVSVEYSANFLDLEIMDRASYLNEATGVLSAEAWEAEFFVTLEKIDEDEEEEAEDENEDEE